MFSCFCMLLTQFTHNRRSVTPPPVEHSAPAPTRPKGRRSTGRPSGRQSTGLWALPATAKPLAMEDALQLTVKELQNEINARIGNKPVSGRSKFFSFSNQHAVHILLVPTCKQLNHKIIYAFFITCLNCMTLCRGVAHWGGHRHWFRGRGASSCSRAKSRPTPQTKKGK